MQLKKSIIKFIYIVYLEFALELYSNLFTFYSYSPYYIFINPHKKYQFSIFKTIMNY